MHTSVDSKNLRAVQDIVMTESQLSESYLPVEQIISPERNWDDLQTVKCPTCGFTYNQVVAIRTVPGHDDYKAGWPGRGDLTVIELAGECGSRWTLCLGFHKGQTGIFVHVIQSCSV